MDLDTTGWPQLPTVGSKVDFHSGGIVLQTLGVCTIVRADHVCNATGKPGGRATLQTAEGELVPVSLSQVRDHAVLVEDSCGNSNGNKDKMGPWKTADPATE